MDAKTFLSQFRKFRNNALEELGDIEDETIVRLFYLYLKQPKSSRYNSFPNSTYLSELFDTFSPYFKYNPHNIDPDSDENNDEL